jgi:large subunit ribosomal protein L18
MQGAALERYQFRRDRVRRKIRESRTSRPRLSVAKSLKHIYAQIIDDVNGQTMVAASSLSAEIKTKLKNGGNRAAAEVVGDLIGRKAVEKGIKSVVFDRGGFVYHGRMKALADAARKAGLEF